MRRGRPAESFYVRYCEILAPGDTQMVVLVNPLPHCFYWMKFCQISFIKCGNDSQAFLVASAMATGPEEGKIWWKKPTTVGDMILQRLQGLLSIRSLLLTNLCIFLLPQAPNCYLTMMVWPVVSCSLYLSRYVNRPSKPATSTQQLAGWWSGIE